MHSQNASALFAEIVAKSAKPAAFDGIADTHTSDPTDSHPPLGARLAALKIEFPAIVADALAVTPAEPASSLLTAPVELEEALSTTYQTLLAQQLGLEPSPESASDDAPAAPAPRGSAPAAEALSPVRAYLDYLELISPGAQSGLGAEALADERMVAASRVAMVEERLGNVAAADGHWSSAERYARDARPELTTRASIREFVLQLDSNASDQPK